MRKVRTYPITDKEIIIITDGDLEVTSTEVVVVTDFTHCNYMPLWRAKQFELDMFENISEIKCRSIPGYPHIYYITTGKLIGLEVVHDSLIGVSGSISDQNAKRFHVTEHTSIVKYNKRLYRAATVKQGFDLGQVTLETVVYGDLGITTDVGASRLQECIPVELFSVLPFGSTTMHLHGVPLDIMSATCFINDKDITPQTIKYWWANVLTDTCGKTEEARRVINLIRAGCNVCAVLYDGGIAIAGDTQLILQHRGEYIIASSMLFAPDAATNTELILTADQVVGWLKSNSRASNTWFVPAEMMPYVM
jgi:hypothetical protein